MIAVIRLSLAYLKIEWKIIITKINKILIKKTKIRYEFLFNKLII